MAQQNQRPLTGLMDSGNQMLALSNEEVAEIATGNLTVCDLADEEVHFSRHSSDYYYCKQSRSNPGTARSLPPGLRLARSSLSNNSECGTTTTTTMREANCSRQHSIDLGQQPQTFVDLDISSSEQASSNKLLQTLSNKLKRGSNYLNAPAKLLGQYLLGITIQSWCEFFNTSRMTRAPCTTRHQLTRRLAANLNHFQGNYLCVSLILVIYCILTSPLLLLAISAYLLALYLVTARSALGKQTRLLGYRLNLQQQYSFITLISLAPLWIAGAPSAIFWVIGASFFVVGLHASMYAIEQLANEHHQHQLATTQTSLACHSLALHTPTHYLNHRQQDYTQLNLVAGGRQRRESMETMHYYNHYPGLTRPNPTGQRQANYSQMPSAPQTTTTTTTTGGYVSNALAQWAIFGGNRTGQTLAIHSNADGKHQAKNPVKVPDVKIISCDYAGLGRVYEV